MITLSNRLQLMADLIECGESVADIGSDHAFLPKFLLASGKCRKVIACDVSEGSLAKARNTLKTGDLRLGYGISVLKPSEVDCIVIAGMGGILISEILAENILLSKSFGRFILQPRNKSGELRLFLHDNGFIVNKNLLVREGDFICEVIVASPKRQEASESSAQAKRVVSPKQSYGHRLYSYDREELIKWEVPESLVKENGALGREYLLKKLESERLILDNMRSTSGTDLTGQLRRVEYLNKLNAEI